MPNLILCLKCGSRWDPAMMQRKKTFTCAMCLEPMPEAMELDKATWEEGDFGNQPSTAQAGKEGT